MARLLPGVSLRRSASLHAPATNVEAFGLGSNPFRIEPPCVMLFPIASLHALAICRTLAP